MATSTNTIIWENGAVQAWPALAGAGPNARLRRGAPLTVA